MCDKFLRRLRPNKWKQISQEKVADVIQFMTERMRALI